MKTNELKKGATVFLRNGWKAVIADNQKGTTRMATVYGDYTETGSVYAHDIAFAVVDGQRIPIEYTPAQEALRQRIAAMGW